MKKFWQTTNTQGKIGAGLIASAGILFILWAAWLSDGDGVSNFVSTGSVVLTIVLFVCGCGYLAVASGGKNADQ